MSSVRVAQNFGPFHSNSGKFHENGPRSLFMKIPGKVIEMVSRRQATPYTYRRMEAFQRFIRRTFLELFLNGLGTLFMKILDFFANESFGGIYMYIHIYINIFIMY